MTAPTQDNDAPLGGSDRESMLSDISRKWSRFSNEELSDLTTNDELVTQLAAKYGLDRIAAQREVDALMAGRQLTT